MIQVSVTKTKKKRQLLSPVKLTALSFLAVIIVGSLLLTTPFTNKGDIEAYINNLFVAVSAVCVTGLTPVTLKDTYNLAGQIVVILLVQIGGLGFLTFTYLFLYTTRQRISLGTKLVFQEAFNQDNLSQLPRILKTTFIYTSIVEGTAAVLWSTVFVPRFGIARGIYFGIWHSISGFCNAGFDLLGSDSLIHYATNPMVNFVACAEIILGGIGFFVVLDLYDKYHREKQRVARFSFKRYLRSLKLHTKLVFITTAALLLGGMSLFFIFEYNNPGTIGHMGLGDRLMTSFFMSTTTRTAGFATVNMYNLHTNTKLIMCLLMFIGGSPSSTAGGIKTVTFALVILTLHSVYRGRDEIYVLGRRIRKRTVLRAFSVFALGLTACVIGIMVMTVSDPSVALPNNMIEIFSAFGTVGLSANVTPGLSVVGKIVDMVLMYTGRIGPVSVILLFARRSQNNANKEIRYPDEDVMVG